MTYTSIHNGTLIDGRGSETVRDAVILIRDNKIQQVGRKRDMTLPDAAIEMIDTYVHALRGLV